MQYDQFIEHVQTEADLSDTDAAARITDVVLATLGESLYRTKCRELGAQLPTRLHEALFAIQDPENARQDVEHVSREEFLNRVRARAEIGGRETEAYTRAVLSVLAEAVSDGALQDVLRALPAEYDALFSQPA
jgi:uncharacterized protein (DUF2267 family)